MVSKDYDWKSRAILRGWPYEGDAPWDKQYQKDRAELFAESGNGWWWSVPNKIHNPVKKRIKRIKKMPKSRGKKQIVSKLGL